MTPGRAATRVAAVVLIVGVVLVVGVVGGGDARAQPAARVVDLPDTPAELRLDETWQDAPLPPGTVEPPVGVWRHPSGAVLVVTRAAAPNPDAWRTKARAAYADDVEAGTRAAAPGYRRRTRALRDLRGVPALDLSFRRGAGKDREIVLMRFLFFRTHTVTAAVAVPEPRWERARRASEAAIAGLGLPPDFVP